MNLGIRSGALSSDLSQHNNITRLGGRPAAAGGIDLEDSLVMLTVFAVNDIAAKEYPSLGLHRRDLKKDVPSCVESHFNWAAVRLVSKVSIAVEMMEIS